MYFTTKRWLTHLKYMVLVVVNLYTAHKKLVEINMKDNENNF